MQRRNQFWALRLGALLAGAQILFCLVAAPGGSIPERFLRMKNWDADRYLDIAAHGYRMPPGASSASIVSEDVHSGKTNAAFFPGLPLASRALDHVGFDAPVALLLTSQAFALLFWALFALTCLELGAGKAATAWAAFLLAIHPAAFFLVCGYSESMFMTGIFGMIYFSRRWVDGSRGSAWLAVVCGNLASAARFLGIAATVHIPIEFSLRWLVRRKPPTLRELLAVALAWAVSMLGALLFFWWCQRQFGEWDLYFKLQSIGWKNNPDYLAIIKPLSYVPRFFFEDTVDSVSRASVPFTALVFGLCFVWERKPRDFPGLLSREPLYVLALLLFYVSLAGKANAKMDSMIRYTLPVFALQLVCLSAMAERKKKSFPRPLLVAGGVLALATQAWLAHRYMLGRWAA